MDIQDFNKKKMLLDVSAARYNWEVRLNDPNTGLLSYIDEFKAYRVDVFTSKMTVCIFPKGRSTIYLKKQSIANIHEIFRNPYKI